MGFRDLFKGKRIEREPMELPGILKPENPVNYDSVLDWLLGLSDKDYKVMLEVVEVYRGANKTSAKLLKIKDQPTTQLIEPKQTDEEKDADLDLLLETDAEDLTEAIMTEPIPTPVKKAQEPKNKKINITEK